MISGYESQLTPSMPKKNVSQGDLKVSKSIPVKNRY